MEGSEDDHSLRIILLVFFNFLKNFVLIVTIGDEIPIKFVIGEKSLLP